MRISSALTLMFGMLALPPAASAQEVRGRVVEEHTRRPVVFATITLLRGSDIVATASTDSSGFYMVTVPGPGRYTVRGQRIGYGEGSQVIEVRAGRAPQIAALVMKAQAVVLDSIEASVRAERRGIPQAWTAGMPIARPMATMAGEKLRDMVDRGVSTTGVLRQLSGSLRVRTLPNSNVECVESTRRVFSLRAEQSGGCKWVAVIIDGLHVGNGSLLRSLYLGNYESVEFLSPLELGVRFGLEASANGAVVLWSRGLGPHRSDARDGGH